MIKTLLGLPRARARPDARARLDVAPSPLEIRARVGYMPESDAHIPA
jgi:hypothetical protein